MNEIQAIKKGINRIEGLIRKSREFGEQAEKYEVQVRVRETIAIFESALPILRAMLADVGEQTSSVFHLLGLITLRFASDPHEADEMCQCLLTLVNVVEGRGLDELKDKTIQ